MGLRVVSERPYQIHLVGQQGATSGDAARSTVWVHDLSMDEQGGREIEIARIGASFQQTFARI